MRSKGDNRRLKRSLGGVLAVMVAATTLVLPATPAQAATAPISGATSWGPCSWFTSNNVRYTSVASKQVRVKLTDTGKLGVKMRSQNVNTGTTSAIRYYPPLDTWQNLGKYSAKNTPFRLQFTCVNERSGSDKPSTDFAGSLDY